MRFEDIIQRLGEFGKYQQIIYVVISLSVIFNAFHNLNIVFILAVPKHRCAIPSLPNDTWSVQNEEHAALINKTIPPNDECNIYQEHVNGTQLIPCDAWVYDKSIFQSTAVTEFNLVCGDKIYRSIVTMMYMIGMVFGGMIGGKLADQFGRKRMMCILGNGFYIFGGALAISQNVFMMMSIRFFAGFTDMAFYAAVYAMIMEFVGPSKRRITGICIGAFFTIGYVLITPVAYFLRNWRYYQLALSMPSVLMIAYWWLIPESPRWLVLHGRTKEAEVTLRKAARVNKVSLPKHLFSRETEPVKIKDSLLRMFKYKILVFRTLVICFNWSAMSMTYYGLSLNSGNLVGDIFINFLVSGFIEFPAMLFVIVTINYFGRKKPHAFCTILGGSACIGSVFVGAYGNDSTAWVITLLSTVGKFGATAAYNIVYLYTAELSPTSLRTEMIGLGSLSAKLVTMLSPYVANLGELVGGHYATSLPLIVFGSVCVIAGLLLLLLPETKGKNLPETIEDSLHYTRRPRKGSVHIAVTNPAFVDLDDDDDSGHVMIVRSSRKKRETDAIPEVNAACAYDILQEEENIEDMAMN